MNCPIRKAGLRAKLLLVFLAVLLLFALVMRLVFSTVFYARAYQQDLQNATNDVAERVRECFASSAFQSAFSQKDAAGCEPCLRFLRDYSVARYAEIWIVADETVMISYNAEKDALEFDEIPSRYHPMLARIFAGQDVGNYEFAGVWNRDRFGVGAPVRNAENEIVAAVITQVSTAHVAALTHSADTAVLLSCAVAVLAALVLAALCSGYFTRPLKRMKAAAESWVTQQYDERTNVRRDDEIGALAASMDVLAERLARLKAEREQSERARYQFFADVSHELKTPVAVLRGQLELLRDGVVTDPDEARACIRDSLGETAQLQRLVEDLLTLAKLESPEFTLVMEPVCLCDVMSDIFRGNRGRVEETGVSLALDNRCRDKAECTVSGDYTRIRQMLSILLDNAFKATPRGGAILIGIAWEGAPVLTVRDSGHGISEEEQARVFERYYTHYSANGGVGLGLPIAHQIAVRHNAALSIISEVSVGTTVTVRFAPSAAPRA